MPPTGRQRADVWALRGDEGIATWGPSGGWFALGSQWWLVCPGVPVVAGLSPEVPAGAGLSSGVPVWACFLVLAPGVSFPCGVAVRATFPLDDVLCTGRPVRGLRLASERAFPTNPGLQRTKRQASCPWKRRPCAGHGFCSQAVRGAAGGTTHDSLLVGLTPDRIFNKKSASRSGTFPLTHQVTPGLAGASGTEGSPKVFVHKKV